VKALVWVLVLLLSVVIEAELIAWSRPLQRWLLRRAAAPLPKEQRTRYIEEWYRELEELPNGPVTRLSWVLFLVLRRGSLARAVGGPGEFARFVGALKRLIGWLSPMGSLSLIFGVGNLVWRHDQGWASMAIYIATTIGSVILAKFTTNFFFRPDMPDIMVMGKSMTKVFRPDIFRRESD
jgi:hypothetical protein